MNKKDKRSRKTARAVQNALLRLLCERRIDEIKIVDLCTAADINRTTFYLHYARIGDVLDELRDEITERICRESEAQFDFSVPADPLPFLKVCTKVLESYEYLGGFVEQSADADMFLTGLKNEFSKCLFGRYKLNCGRSSETAQYVLRFLVGAVLDSYTEWLKTRRLTPVTSVMFHCTPMERAGLDILSRIIRDPLPTVR